MRQFQSSFVISKTTLKNIETALREKARSYSLVFSFLNATKT